MYLCTKIDRGSSSLRVLNSTIQLRIDSYQPAQACHWKFHNVAYTNVEGGVDHLSLPRLDVPYPHLKITQGPNMSSYAWNLVSDLISCHWWLSGLSDTICSMAKNWGGNCLLVPLSPLGPPVLGWDICEEHNERLSFSGRTGLYFIEHTELVLKNLFMKYFFCSQPWPSRASRSLWKLTQQASQPYSFRFQKIIRQFLSVLGIFERG